MQDPVKLSSTNFSMPIKFLIELRDILHLTLPHFHRITEEGGSPPPPPPVYLRTDGVT